MMDLNTKIKKKAKLLTCVVIVIYIIINIMRCTFGGVSGGFAKNIKDETTNGFNENKVEFEYVAKKIVNCGETLYFYKQNSETRSIDMSKHIPTLVKDEEFMDKIKYILYDLNYSSIEGCPREVIFEKTHKNRFYVQLQYYPNPDDNSQEGSGDIQLDTNFFYSNFYLN